MLYLGQMAESQSICIFGDDLTNDVTVFTDFVEVDLMGLMLCG